MFNIVEYDQQWKKSELTTLANLVDLPEIGNSEIANAAADLITGSRRDATTRNRKKLQMGL